MEPLVAQMLTDMGISLIDPAPQFAKEIIDLEHFMRVLQACEPKKRKTAYEALRPHLSFEVPDYSAIRFKRKRRETYAESDRKAFGSKAREVA